jgi:hypothetical protein
MEMSGQLHVPTTSIAHRIVGSVDLRAGMDAVEKRRSHALSGILSHQVSSLGCILCELSQIDSNKSELHE